MTLFAFAFVDFYRSMAKYFKCDLQQVLSEHADVRSLRKRCCGLICAGFFVYVIWVFTALRFYSLKWGKLSLWRRALLCLRMLLHLYLWLFMFMVLPQCVYLICEFLKIDHEKAVWDLDASDLEIRHQDVEGLTNAHFRNYKNVRSFSKTFKRCISAFLCSVIYMSIIYPIHGVLGVVAQITFISIFAITVNVLSMPATSMKDFNERVNELRVEKSQLTFFLLFKIDLNMDSGAIQLYSYKMTKEITSALTFKFIVSSLFLKAVINSPIPIAFS